MNTARFLTEPKCGFQASGHSWYLLVVALATLQVPTQHLVTEVLLTSPRDQGVWTAAKGTELSLGGFTYLTLLENIMSFLTTEVRISLKDEAPETAQWCRLLGSHDRKGSPHHNSYRLLWATLTQTETWKQNFNGLNWKCEMLGCCIAMGPKATALRPTQYKI